MNIEIDKSKEYSFAEAWTALVNNINTVITSKATGLNYLIKSSNRKTVLKYYNPVIKGWQNCTYVLPDEIFDKWYVTKKS